MISKYFYQRCAVGTMDLAYPSNKFAFTGVVNDGDVPAIIFKLPGLDNKIMSDMVKRDHMFTNTASDFGLLFSKK